MIENKETKPDLSFLRDLLATVYIKH